MREVASVSRAQDLHLRPEPVAQGIDAKGVKPHRGELEREGQTVKLAAQFEHCGRAVRIDREAPSSRCRPLHEQRDRVRLPGRGRRMVVGIGHRHRLDEFDDFAGNAEGLATRGEDLEIRAPAQQRAGEHRDRLENVLAVVEHEQDTLVGQVIAEQRDRPGCRAILQPERRCDRRSDVRTQRDLRQRHEIRAIGEVRAEIAGRAQRQSRLPDAAGPGEGHESRCAEASLDRSQLVATPHEARELRGEIRDAARVR